MPDRGFAFAGGGAGGLSQGVADGLYARLRSGVTYSALAPGTGIAGDGSTDDAAAIGTWLATLPVGAQAFFPAATYKIGAAITPPAQQLYLLGEGEGTIFNVTADGIVALTLTGSNNRSSFARFKFQLATTAPTSMLLKLDAVFNNDFDRVTFIGQKTSQAATYDGQIGVFSTNNAGDTRFRACTFTQLGIGVVQDCEETTYDTCHINQNKVNLLTFGAGAGAKVIGGIAKGSSNTGGASVSDYGFLFAGLGHHQMSSGWCEAVNTACLQVGQNTTASTTVAAGSNGATLAAIRTLAVASTAGFPTSGTATVVTSTGTKSFAYSNLDATNFYGVVSSGTGTVSTGAAAATTPVGPVTCSITSAFFNGGATYGLDVQKGRINGSAVVGSPGTFGTPVRLDGTNASGLLTLDIPSGTLPTVPNTFSVTYHVSSSPGSWASPVVVTTQGSNRSLTYADANTMISASGAITLTVPTNATTAFPIGTVIGMVATGGQITVAAAGGVTVNNASSLTSRATNSMIFLTKLATDTWVLSGDVT